MSRLESSERHFPPRISPMLARESRQPFDREGWLFEAKWDGFRGLASVDKGQVDLYSRKQNSLAERFPKITESLTQIDRKVLLDGEVVILDNTSKPNFDMIRSYHPKNREGKEGTEGYFVFDLLELDGENIMQLPLQERKQLLHETLPPLNNVQYTPHIETEGTIFYEGVKAQGLEGMVAKKSDSLYKPGERSKDWLKVKAYVRHGWKKQVPR